MKDDAVSNLLRRDRFKYSIIAEGVLIGLITGALISVFRLMLIYADQLRDRMTGFARSGWLAALICALIMLAAAAVITALLSWEPDIAGSGIPQVEAELMGQKDMCWWRVIIAKTLGCALAIGGGLALGREGPSIQLGSMVGKGFSRAGHRLLTEERLLITCGAGAGLSAAFGAPLAGAIFALEELHRNFSAEVLLSTMAASVASDFVAANVFGLDPVFGFGVEHGLPLKYYWAVVVIGIVLGFFGIVYNRTIAFMQDFFEAAGRGFAHLADRVPGVSAFNLTDRKLNKKGRTGCKIRKTYYRIRIRIHSYVRISFRTWQREQSCGTSQQRRVYPRCAGSASAGKILFFHCQFRIGFAGRHFPSFARSRSGNRRLGVQASRSGGIRSEIHNSHGGRGYGGVFCRDRKGTGDRRDTDHRDDR